LWELLLAVTILAFVLSSLLLLYFNCFFQNQSNRDITLAYSAIQSKMEEVRGAGYNNLYITYPGPCPAGCFCDGDTFTLDGFTASTGKGRIEISDETTKLKKVRINACFMSRGRLYGDSIDNCQNTTVRLVTFLPK